MLELLNGGKRRWEKEDSNVITIQIHGKLFIYINEEITIGILIGSHACT